MARLPDGRFVVIEETQGILMPAPDHHGVIFAGDPTRYPDGEAFAVEGPGWASVVDMALLPDRRALVLLRRIRWRFPLRFDIALAIADTDDIAPGRIWRLETVTRFPAALEPDNFEGLMVEPAPGGRLAIWMISDDNRMEVLQRTLLWKLSVDPADLPGARAPRKRMPAGRKRMPAGEPAAGTRKGA